jgi:heme exporter protein B
MELRQKYAINGILLYVFATLFIIKSSLFQVRPDVWIALFWIVMLFASVNAGAKSFIQEGRGRLLYYYTIASPEDIVLAKFLYNCVLLLILGFLSLGGFILFFENIIGNLSYFIVIIILGSIGFAASFTMISGIASKAKGSATLMTVLSFPIVLPQLLLAIKLSKKAVDGFSFSVGYKELVALGMINLIVVIVSYMLFPYLWRE